jgi:hypothetical protein
LRETCSRETRSNAGIAAAHEGSMIVASIDLETVIGGQQQQAPMARNIGIAEQGPLPSQLTASQFTSRPQRHRFGDRVRAIVESVEKP